MAKAEWLETLVFCGYDETRWRDKATGARIDNVHLGPVIAASYLLKSEGFEPTPERPPRQLFSGWGMGWIRPGDGARVDLFWYSSGGKASHTIRLTGEDYVEVHNLYGLARELGVRDTDEFTEHNTWQITPITYKS